MSEICPNLGVLLGLGLGAAVGIWLAVLAEDVHREVSRWWNNHQYEKWKRENGR